MLEPNFAATNTLAMIAYGVLLFAFCVVDLYENREKTGAKAVVMAFGVIFIIYVTCYIVMRVVGIIDYFLEGLL